MVPVLVLDKQIKHLQGRYIIPKHAPIHFSRRCDRGTIWKLGPTKETEKVRLSSTEHHLMDYFCAEEIAYQFHPGAGIFYALMQDENENFLTQKLFGCEVHAHLPPNIAEILNR